ncbi:MAG: hypothetical protein IJV50_10385 [Lachnospiraceae bacterium]|nr:hypothetical protein [Lachnospiraceae bacterium]
MERNDRAGFYGAGEVFCHRADNISQKTVCGRECEGKENRIGREGKEPSIKTDVREQMCAIHTGTIVCGNNGFTDICEILTHEGQEHTETGIMTAR